MLCGGWLGSWFVGFELGCLVAYLGCRWLWWYLVILVVCGWCHYLRFVFVLFWAVAGFGFWFWCVDW